MSDEKLSTEQRLRDAETKVRSTEKALNVARGKRVATGVWSAIGAVLLVVVGANWYPGYQLDSAAETAAQERARDAVTVVMAELCAERFLLSAGVEERLAELYSAGGDWSQANFLRDGAWTKLPDGERSSHDAAEQCRQLIAARADVAPLPADSAS